MKEHINRQGDEKIYQPRIHKDLITKLYSLRQLTGLPMTVLVDQALREFIERQSEPVQESQPQVLGQDSFECLRNYREPYQTDPSGKI